MTKGQVKWFDPKKGYGFIVGPENQDVFVHYSHIQSDGFRSLKDGEWVEYELVQGDKGWQARSVQATGEGVPAAAPSGGGGGAGGGGGGGGGGNRGGGGGGKPQRGGGKSKPRPQSTVGRSSADLHDRPRGSSTPADTPPRDTPGSGYKSTPQESKGYEGYTGYETSDDDDK
jgi:CspA family cold shock protein